MFRTSLVSDGKCHNRTRQAGLDGSTKSGRIPRLRSMVLQVSCLAVMASGLSGCMTIHNGFEAITNNGAWNDTVLVLRNRSFSAKAWHRRKKHFCREKHLKDFCAGFRAGYEDVAAGAGECTPAFPPQEYWGWEFQSAEGQARTSAWFAGYPQGARAAEEDGVGSWHQISMSTGLQAQYQQNGTFSHDGTVYPIPNASVNAHNGASIPDNGPYPLPESFVPQGEAIVPMETAEPVEGLLDPTIP